MKTCYQCGESKSLNLFSKNKTRKDGHSSLCKSCSKDYYSDYVRKHKGAYKEYARTTRKKIRQEVFDYLKSHPCVDCGESNPVVLEFDHVRGQKRCHLSHMIRRGYGLKVVRDEIKKCEIRCSNCHKIRTAKVKGWYKDLIQ